MLDMLNQEQVKKYFERIGQSKLFEAFQRGEAKPSHGTLRDIFFHHALTFPFENLDMHNVLNDPKEPTTIKLNAIFEKMVLNRRGGYCFETNELLRQVLKFLKFDVKTFNAGVHWLKTKKILPCHEVLIVTLDGDEYLVEPGFGSPSPLEPLLFRKQGKLYEQEQVFEQHDVKRFRFMIDEDGEFHLQGQVSTPWWPQDPWKPLYSFKTESPCNADVFIKCNQKVSTTEESPFLDRLIVTIPFKIDDINTGRKTLMQDSFKVSTPAGDKKTVVQSQDHFFELLASEFNIKLPAGSSLTAQKVKFAEPVVSGLESRLAAMLATPAAAIVMPMLQAATAPVPLVPAFRASQQVDSSVAVLPLAHVTPSMHSASENKNTM